MAEEQKIHRITIAYELSDTKSKQIAEKDHGTGTEDYNGKGQKPYAGISISYIDAKDFLAQVKGLSTNEFVEGVQELQTFVKSCVKTMTDDSIIPVIVHSDVPKPEPKPEPKKSYPPQSTGPTYTKDGKIEPNHQKSANNEGGLSDEELRNIIRKYMNELSFKEGDYGFSKKMGADFWNVGMDKNGLGVYTYISRKGQDGKWIKIYMSDPTFPETLAEITRKCDALVANFKINSNRGESS